MSVLTGYLRYVLMQNAPVYSEVGARIYPKKLPVNPTLPALVIIEPGTNTEITTDSYSRIQISAFHSKGSSTSAYDNAWALSAKVKKALLNHSGSRNGVYVNDGITHIIDIEPQDDDDLISVVHSDYGVIWETH